MNPQSPGRRPTRTVMVGDVAIGSEHPIRVQSMINASLADPVAAAREVDALARAGCELVRVTTPSLSDVDRLREMRRELSRRSVRVPIVADVHFTPKVAFAVLEVVDKVRINPGNFADRKRWAVEHYSDGEYERELERVAEKFSPLVRRAKALGRALRIGSNHGSLSDRVLSRYGDTPLGMVESALEYGAVCRDEGFFDVVYSMKSSNPRVMIAAYRLLAERLDSQGKLGAPLHLGVTEAGRGIDGRIKSAVGIGSLIEEGLGDTVRVSLTEPSVNEIPVARQLAERAARTRCVSVPPPATGPPDEASDSFLRRGTGLPPVVELEAGHIGDQARGRIDSMVEQLSRASDLRCEGLIVDVFEQADIDRARSFAERLHGLDPDMVLRVRAELCWIPAVRKARLAPLLLLASRTPRYEIEKAVDLLGGELTAVEWSVEFESGLEEGGAVLAGLLDVLDRAGQSALVVGARSDAFAVSHRRLAHAVTRAGFEAEVALRHRGTWADPLAAVIHPAVDLGALLCDGIGTRVSTASGAQPLVDLDLLYRILQGARARMIRPEYISCPSCGRTQFDLESVTRKIQARTGHLQDVKIAIMGCIVNGPGEMADADFGYVGSGPGTVHLFVGRERVEAHVPEREAPDRLEALIRRTGRWRESTAAQA